MPLSPNMTVEQKAQYFDFWGDVFRQLGFEPVMTKGPASCLLLPGNSIDMQQVADLRAIAQKYLTYADQLEADLNRNRPVAPQNGGEAEEPDMMLPPGYVPPAQRPAPVAPRVRGAR